MRKKRNISDVIRAFYLWLFLDNHDFFRIIFECDEDTAAEKNAIDFTMQWDEPFLMFYTERKRS